MNLAAEARALRVSISRKQGGAHRQIALRRISEVLLLVDKNPSHAQAMMAEAKFHAQFCH